ncbi:hypothetical protein [Neorhodopirellula pilleata]|uniref:Uncharacterized protein n=1 Tax=Neorhodopirellula pilleata TaxID=2714738 RepID=A0A5C6A8Y6_9BACT|nr:hypothetical protein [Neorhodopirellula pilleata]TWT95768.1 hypothetical protein Pla100_34100 [Neorhodopirellula pilleata]
MESLLSQHTQRNQPIRKNGALNETLNGQIQQMQKDQPGTTVPQPSPTEMDRRRAMAAGGLANVLAANPMRRQATPAQASREQLLNQFGDIRNRMTALSTLGNAPPAVPGEASASMQQVTGPRSAAGSIGSTDQYNITARNGVYNAGPQMSAGSGAIDAAYAARNANHVMPSVPQDARVTQGMSLDRLFPSPGDAGSRSKFEEYRDRRGARRTEARGMRQQQLAEQRQARIDAQNQVPVINPFMNPIAMQAMRRDPTLAMGAINNLNEALQGRGRLQSQNSATLAELGLKGRAQSLQEALGTGRLQLEQQGQTADNSYRDRALEAETGFRTQQAEAQQRSADASYMSAEAQAERQRAEAQVIADPENRMRQQQMDLMEIGMASPNPIVQQQAADLFEALGMQSPADERPDLSPLPFRPQPDQMTGELPPEQMDMLMSELTNGQGLSGPSLMAALLQQGVSRDQAERYYSENFPGAIARGIDRIQSWIPSALGGETDFSIRRKYGPFYRLNDALGIGY